MSYLLTASGKHLEYSHPDPDAIDIYDIAQALSRESRFNGHTGLFYSVAQHSVLVSKQVEPHFRMEALLHDAAEAYLKDLPSPLKALLPDYNRLEIRLDAVIRRKFRLPEVMSPEVKYADMVLLATERRDMMPHENAIWSCLEGIEPLDEKIYPVADHAAQRYFLSRYMDLLCGGEPRG